MNAVAVKREKSKAPKLKNEKLIGEVEALTLKVFGSKPTRASMPGGKSRPVFIVEIDGEMYVVAKRSNKYEAKVEAAVLKKLSPSGAVPKYIGASGRWLVQEYVNGPRLPWLIDQAETAKEKQKLLVMALDSLIAIQKSAARVNLKKKVPQLGVVDNWIMDRINAADEISDKLDIDRISINKFSISGIFNVRDKDFIKWDSRPGNALVQGDRMVWFDWEDCGRRHRLDDLVCFMADEWNSVSVENGKALIEDYIPKFSPGMDPARARKYFYVAGCLQILFRLNLAIGYYCRDNEWWDRDMCLKGDKVGVTPSEVGRLCERLMAWSDEYDFLNPYRGWVIEVIKKLSL